MSVSQVLYDMCHNNVPMERMLLITVELIALQNGEVDMAQTIIDTLEHYGIVSLEVRFAMGSMIET